MITLPKPILITLVGASTLGLVAGCWTPPKPMPQMKGMSMAMGTSGLNALKNLKGKEFDIAYLSQMIAHHQAAVVMARQALGVAKMPDVKTNAQHVIDSQTKEITTMTAWLLKWYGVAPDVKQQALVNDDMKAMMSMPIASDSAYLEMMTPHHQGAIEMSQIAKSRSARPEIKQLAQQIIAAQTKEIADYHKMIGH